MKENFEKVPYNHSYLPIYTANGVVKEGSILFYNNNWHADVEFVYVKKGNIGYSINGESFILHEGEVLFINSNQIHYNFSENMEYCEFLCVIINSLSILNNKEMTEKFVLPVLTKAVVPYVILRDEAVRESLEDICVNQEASDYELRLYSAVYRMWTKLFPKLSTKRKMEGKREIESFKNMIRYIYTNYKQKISLNEIAEAGNVCQTSCNTIFNKYAGLTPIEYLNDYRLRQSILLMNTEMNLTQICYEVGFSSASYYAETFRKTYGITPKKYRDNT